MAVQSKTSEMNFLYVPLLVFLSTRKQRLVLRSSGRKGIIRNLVTLITSADRDPDRGSEDMLPNSYLGDWNNRTTCSWIRPPVIWKGSHSTELETNVFGRERVDREREGGRRSLALECGSVG